LNEGSRDFIAVVRFSTQDRQLRKRKASKEREFLCRSESNNHVIFVARIRCNLWWKPPIIFLVSLKFVLSLRSCFIKKKKKKKKFKLMQEQLTFLFILCSGFLLGITFFQLVLGQSRASPLFSCQRFSRIFEAHLFFGDGDDLIFYFFPSTLGQRGVYFKIQALDIMYVYAVFVHPNSLSPSMWLAQEYTCHHKFNSLDQNKPVLFLLGLCYFVAAITLFGTGSDDAGKVFRVLPAWGTS
jgi:hypothetical protein